MPTNSDKWFVGPIPASKGFYIDENGVETQVYPVDDGGGGCFPGGDVFTYSVTANAGQQLRQYLMLDDDRPVFVASNGYNYNIYESVDGLPNGTSTPYPVVDGKPHKSAGAIQVRGTNDHRDRLIELVAEKMPSQNGAVPYEAVSGYESMGDLVAMPILTLQIAYLLPENTFAPCMYHYTIRDGGGWPFVWPDWTFAGGPGKGVGDLVLISAEPLFGFEKTSLRSQLASMAQAVAEGFCTKAELDETTAYYKERGLL
jgi:hypothetical protein